MFLSYRNILHILKATQSLNNLLQRGSVDPEKVQQTSSARSQSSLVHCTSQMLE